METASTSVRCINVVNFLRAVEPRGPMDLFLPLQKQMEVILEHRLPATWLLQFDALVSGPFVAYLKAHMPPEHEVGIWFEMNEMHCKAAGVEWRGRPGYEWDHLPPVAFTIGYTPEEPSSWPMHSCGSSRRGGANTRSRWPVGTWMRSPWRT